MTKNAVYNPNPKVYKEDIYLVLTKVTNAYFSFALENRAFFKITLANMFMPASSDVFKFVEKYHFAQFDILERMFGNMAKSHGNLKGKSRTLAWSFVGTINSNINLYFSKISGHSLNDKTVHELVHQFMHGIYA